jgi:thiazole synthase
MKGPLKIGGRTFRSRLILGTGKYENFRVMQEAHEASGTEFVTVAVRRIDLADRGKESIWSYIDAKKISLLPNTAGCYTADEAVRTARMARELCETDFIKLEVIGDEKTLLPDIAGLLEATRVLVKEKFVVMPYTNDDPIAAKKLEEAGASCVMPLAAPIGSGMGVQNRLHLGFLLEQAGVPVIVDAGVGTASDAAIAMEMGADGVLMNTAVACAKDPLKMARAMKLAIESGRLAYESGRIPRKRYASASSPETGLVE